MLPCQQSMMLQTARQFESLIKNPKGSKIASDRLTWNDPDELEKFTLTLQAAAERLSTENRKLRKLHQKISDIVVNLMNTDLLRQQQKWKDYIFEIRQVINEASQMVCSKTLIKPKSIHYMCALLSL